jgi:hypothetical protein
VSSSPKRSSGSSRTGGELKRWFPNPTSRRGLGVREIGQNPPLGRLTVTAPKGEAASSPLLPRTVRARHAPDTRRPHAVSHRSRLGGDTSPSV